jgi:hypothetical protein
MTERQQVDAMRSDGTVVDRLDLEDARLLAACGYGRLLPTEDGGLVLLLDDPPETKGEDE